MPILTTRSVTHAMIPDGEFKKRMYFIVIKQGLKHIMYFL